MEICLIVLDDAASFGSTSLLSTYTGNAKSSPDFPSVPVLESIRALGSLSCKLPSAVVLTSTDRVRLALSTVMFVTVPFVIMYCIVYVWPSTVIVNDFHSSTPPTSDTTGGGEPPPPPPPPPPPLELGAGTLVPPGTPTANIEKSEISVVTSPLIESTVVDSAFHVCVDETKCRNWVSESELSNPFTLFLS